MEKKTEKNIELKDKYALTVEESVAYYGIGENKLRELCTPNQPYVLMVGRKILVKREMFTKYLDNRLSI